MMTQRFSAERNQRGVILIVVLVMLGIFTLIVAALVRTGNINFRIAGNQQYRQEARMAAQNAIESYISTATNFDSPPAAPASYAMDLDGDDVAEYSATVPPASEMAKTAVNPKDPVLSDETSAACDDIHIGDAVAQDSDVGGMQPSSSPCAWKVFDVIATVNDEATGASVELHQGINRLSKD